LADFGYGLLELASLLRNFAGAHMRKPIRIVTSGILAGLIGLVMGCVVVPHEGYYDSNNHRYYHEHEWHECGDGDSHCH
jgi:hypothetical protein